jgi:hypothetical protein
MPHDDFAFEYAPGLPQKPPQGEEILWQGRPNAWRLTVDSLKLYWVWGYFALLAFYRFASAIFDHGIAVAVASIVPIIALAGAATAVLFLIGFIQARVAIYTITSERVIFRVGAATSVTLQIPFRQMQNASLDLRKSGYGTIVIEPKEDGGAMLSFWYLWPHARPWVWKVPQPALRCIPDAERVAGLLAEAAEDRMAQPEVTRAATRRPVATAQPARDSDSLSGVLPAE